MKVVTEKKNYEGFGGKIECQRNKKRKKREKLNKKEENEEIK